MPLKHDNGVPAPFQQGVGDEESLGVIIQPPTSSQQNGTNNYTSIALVGPSPPLRIAHYTCQRLGKEGGLHQSQ